MKYFLVILLLSLFQDGVLSLTWLLAKVCALSACKPLTNSLSLPRKSALRLTGRPDMTIYLLIGGVVVTDK